tara:strand:+ start:5905 stop:6135 length:231 start_codon:yes stop_codon:yes gene_type:complete
LNSLNKLARLECRECGGEGFVDRGERQVTVIFEHSYIDEQTKKIEYEEVEKKEKIGGVDICKTCQRRSEVEYLAQH